MKTKSRAHREKIAQATTKLWKDPKYRARMIEKQRALGLRSYNN